MEVPINKYLANDYRENLGTPDAPAFIDAKLPIQAMVDIQKGLPKPNSKQKMHYSYIAIGAANTTGQLATKSSTNKIYFICAYAVQNSAAITANVAVFDATSGTGPSTSANTVYTDNAGYIFAVNFAASAGQTAVFQPPMPIEVINGLRCFGGAASSNIQLVVVWLEETLN